MVILENRTPMFKGQPVTDEKGVPHTTATLIDNVLEGSAYPTAREIIKASKILGRIKVENNQISIEDEDFKFVKQWANVYTPLTSKGILFQDFFMQLEDENGS